MPAWLVSLLPGFLGRVFDFADGWQERRKQVLDAKHEVRVSAIKAHKGSLKDEYVLFIFSYPIISAFIPPLRANTEESLEFISSLPPWISGGFVTISLAIYGLDKLIKIKS
jgi:hypothetical protein